MLLRCEDVYHVVAATYEPGVLLSAARRFLTGRLA